jgi:hypothetical protein
MERDAGILNDPGSTLRPECARHVLHIDRLPSQQWTRPDALSVDAFAQLLGGAENISDDVHRGIFPCRCYQDFILTSQKPRVYAPRQLCGAVT